MPNHWQICENNEFGAHIVGSFDALPIQSHSLDLLLLPHTLDLSRDPHACLHEAHRVLVPEGRVILFGFAPWSLFRVWHKLSKREPVYPDDVENVLSVSRIKDWMKLLGLQIETGFFGCYRPALVDEKNMQHLQFLESAGDRWWPALGAVYCLQAVKREYGMRLIGPHWKTKQTRAPALIAATQRDQLSQKQTLDPP